MFIRQLSVFVENKKGRLAEITRLISGAGVNICALSIADTTNFGVLRMVVDCPEKAEEALKSAGVTVKLNHVVGVAIQDRPGGFYEVVRLLADRGIDIDYLYAAVARGSAGAYLVMRVKDRDTTAEVLSSAGFSLLTESDLI